MKRRTLDIMFSFGGLALAALLAVLGLVLTANANFANDYVHDQLSEQKITFKAADTLSDEEAAQPCLVTYAGQDLTAGKQAECYANNFIGLHLEGIADGMTYSELGTPQSELRSQIADAQASGADVTELQAQLDAVTAQRETVFKGETLRGLLLTSYGFSEFGRKADQAATVTFVVAALLALLSIAGFVHAFRTSPAEAVGEPEHVRTPGRDPARV